ncbi:MAG: M3 family metallopeptidase [Gammaproteobacteria bacterium]
MSTNPLLETGELPGFSSIRPEHVEPAIRETLDNNRRELEALLTDAGSRRPDFGADILPLEDLADRLHRVWSPVSHLHAVTNSPERRTAYNNCLPELTRSQTELAQNEGLQQLYQRLADMSGEDSAGGTQAAESSLIRLALRDFRLAGVSLPEERKRRFKAVMEELAQLQARFEQNVLDSMASWQCVETDQSRLAGLPDTVLERAAASAGEAGCEGWLFSLDQPTYTAVITHAENRDLRYRFYRAWMTRASDQAPDPQRPDEQFDNSAVIDQILALRHEAANLIDYENFAAYSLASKMADSVADVREFLEDLGSRSRTTAQRELEELERFAGRGLAAWDIAFYAERQRRERFSVSDEQLRPYFPLERVLSGMFMVVGQLYGISVRRTERVDAWHPDVRFYRIEDEHGEEIGGFYTDLFARANKRSGAWMDECVIRRHAGSHLHKPVAHLVCNFAAPTATTPCLLTHDDVVTLFHEFGHTLHHVLTRVRYPSVSGINGVPWDAVELPSQFMENFAWQPEVVTMISGHYESGDPLPGELLKRLRASRVFHAGLHMARQLELALFDLRLHAEYDPAAGADVTALLEDVREQVAVVRQPEFNRLAHAFSHIFGGGYAAGYYSYKWAEVLAADAWSAFEEHGIFDSRTADRFRRVILEIGGTRDIGAAFADFRGRAPSIEPLLSQSGIGAAEVAG